MVKQSVKVVLVAMLALLSIPVPGRTMSITRTYMAPFNQFQLDAHNFSSYASHSYALYPAVTGVSRGCDVMHFTANAALTSSFSRHTFTVWLKRDGATVQSGTAQFGPFFTGGNIYISFDPVEFRPGTWSIEWYFANQNQQHGSQSITLIAPVLTTLPQFTSWNANYEYCNRNGYGLVATYSNGACAYRTIPPTGFINTNNGSFYMNATPLHTCAVGSYNGAGQCFIGFAPGGTMPYAQGSMWYWHARYCPPGIQRPAQAVEQARPQLDRGPAAPPKPKASH